MGIETGSYDAALHMAGIEKYNVMLYTSVLPPEAAELAHLPDIHHGSVLEGIIAVQHTDKPRTRITAGCSWPRFIAILTALTWAALRANTPETARSKKRKPICGKRCSSFSRGATRQSSTNSSLLNWSFAHSRRRNRSGRFLLASALPATLCRY